MNPLSILLLGLAMSTDAFAAALGKGAAMSRPGWTNALRIGLIFGVVEAITPVVGWGLGTAAARYVEAWDHWIAFCTLGALGLHMIYKSLVEKDEVEKGDAGGRDVWTLALTGLATSIDAMAVGVGLAFVEVNILVVAAVIGLCTFAMVTLGIMAGRVLGAWIGRRAELAGGVILILVGATILYEHLSAAGA
jgi:putative Mn2+ efflux pump MntP